MLPNPGSVYKYLEQCCGRFWTPKNILTYNKPWNFITGSRSVGKSTGLAIYFVLDYIVNKHKFVYSRRTKDETLLTCGTYFGNAISIINSKTEIRIQDFYYEGGHYYIKYNGMENPEECGHTIPLSLEQKYKSTNLSDVFNVIYDEFIAKDSTGYLGTAAHPETEYIHVLSLYQTIDRGIDTPYRNETRFFFSGNTATIYNPLFLSLSISSYIDDRARFISPKNKLWVLERVAYVEALGDVETSFAYQLATEQERAYAYENKGADPTSFIKQPGVCHYDYTVILDGTQYGISHDADNNFYIQRPRPEVGAQRISLDIKGHDGNDLMLIHKWSLFPIMRVVSSAYQRGQLFFYSGKAQNAFLKYLRFMP